MVPLALLDGALWGIEGKIPLIYCQYTDSEQTGLRFRRDAGGVLSLLPESRKRLLEWEEELTDMGCEVNINPKPTFKAKYIKFAEVTDAKPDIEQLMYASPVLIAPKPHWHQYDQTPKSGGRAMRFLCQACPTDFTMNAADFYTYLFINATGTEVAIVWQNS